MFSWPHPIVTPIFEPKLHDVMTLPSSHFDSVSLLLLNTYRHFDVTPRNGSILSAISSLFNTFLSPFGSIPISRTASADVLWLPYSFILHFNRFCKRTPMAPSMLNALDVSAFHLLQACHIRLAFQSHSIFAFLLLYTYYIITVVMTELPH